ncbi:hypothetical protein TWF281_009780 [Arthrobotrys megalospora]
MVDFSYLPVEIQELVAKELDATDLRELCLVSKKINSIVIPILYATIRLNPNPIHGIANYQNDALFNPQRPNPHLRHVRNLQVIHPRNGKNIISASVQYIESQVKPRLRENQLLSLSLVSSRDSVPDVVSFLADKTQLRALHVDIPLNFPDTDFFAYLGIHHHTLRTLSLRLLKDWDNGGDNVALSGLLSRLKNLHSLDLKFKEYRSYPIAPPPLWAHGLELLDTIFGIESLRELSLLGNNIPLGYWAQENRRKKVGKGFTLFRSEAVDRADGDSAMCDKEDLFWFENFDPTTLRRWSFCLGIIYMEVSERQTVRYVTRNNRFQKLLASCEHLEELRVCNLPQMMEFSPNDHCLFRVKDTLRKLRICSNDWYGMDFLDQYITGDTYHDRQKNIIAELKALKVLELTLQWLNWDISSQSLELVHILREPEPSHIDYGSGDPDAHEVDTVLQLPPREIYLQEQAQRFAKLTQKDFLPSLKILMFSRLSFYREHCHAVRFEGTQLDHRDYAPLLFSVEIEGESDLPYGVAEPISFREIEYRLPWLYDGKWQGKIWDESQRYRFW